MSKIRINDLARELEVKSKAILDALVVSGVTTKKTHSSSLEGDEAEKVRAHFKKQGEGNGSGSRSAARESDGIKTKIDLSNISRPGDVLKALTQKQAPMAAPPKSPAAPASMNLQATSAPPTAPAAPPAAVTAEPPAPPAPRLVVPPR